jgi:hypothetical protein
VATAIDLLCVNLRTDELILVELKVTNHHTPTGYEAATGHLPGFGDRKIPASYMNHDMLQLAGMAIMLRKEYDVDVANAFLIRVGHGIVWLYKLPQWTRECAETIYSKLK